MNGNSFIALGISHNEKKKVVIVLFYELSYFNEDLSLIFLCQYHVAFSKFDCMLGQDQDDVKYNFQFFSFASFIKYMILFTYSSMLYVELYKTFCNSILLL